MYQILTEQDLAVKWDEISPHRWCLIVTRARALLVQRDALKAERYEAIRERDEAREQCSLMTAERDTLAARVKELEDRPRGAAIIPADVPFKGCWNDHETVKKYRGALEAEVANLRKELASVKAERDTLAARVKELEADVKSLDNSLLSSQRDRDAHREAHRLLAAGLGATPLCACCKRPVLGFVFCDSCEARAADRNGTSPPIPDPDPRDAEIRALKDELARVRGVREAIPGEGDLHVFSFLTKIREVLGCNKFGYDLVDAIKAMKEELEQAKSDAEFGRAALKHAETLGIDTNKELGQQYRALRRDAEAWRRMFPSVHPDEASKIVVRYHFRDKDTKEVVVKDNGAPEYSSTAVNLAKTGLQPMKCVCGGEIEFGRERVGHCMNCGASCRVMDPPPGDTEWTVADLYASFDETRKWRERAHSWRKACKAARQTLINAQNVIMRGSDFSEPEDWEDSK